MMETRDQIRYSLFRCKNGGAEPHHLSTYDKYKNRVEAMGFSINDFAEKWDIKKESIDAVVAGAWVQVYKEELDKSLFDEQGKLLEA